MHTRILTVIKKNWKIIYRYFISTDFCYIIQNFFQMFFFITIFHESLFNLAFFSNDFLEFSCQYFHFIFKTLEEFRVWMAEKGINSYNEKILVSQ